MLPVKPPQLFHLSDRHIEGIDEDIIETISAPNSNNLLFITKTRLFVYQAKPLAPLACHERTPESVELFGVNKGIRDNLPFGSNVKGLLKNQFSVPVIENKWYFYVITENNFLLVYEVFTRTSESTVYKEYGVPLKNLDEHYFDNKTGEDDNDDEVLTVFDMNENHKVIQSGYAINKQRGFLQFMRNTESADELPIRKIELRLNVVLKFDHVIMDVIGMIVHNKNGTNFNNQYLLVLFDHGLQVLRLEDFKLIDNTLINTRRGNKLFFCEEEVMVLCNSSDGYFLNSISFEEQSVQTHKVSLVNTSDNYTSSAVFGHLVLIAFGRKLVYFDVKNKLVINEWISPTDIIHIVVVSSDMILLLTQNNVLLFISKWGNILLSTTLDDQLFKALHASVLATKVLISGTNGAFQIWDLWKKLDGSLSNFRSSKVFTLLNDNNDLLLYSSMSEATNTSVFQTIKLPTKTVNNVITICKVNGPLTSLAVYVANKNILLINFLNTNSWVSFDQLYVKSADWLGNDYLLCHIVDEETDQETVKCYHFPLSSHTSTKLEDFKIWEWDVPRNTKLENFFINTLFSYKMLKFKDSSEDEEFNKSLYKTCEVLMVLSNGKVIMFDILSSVHPSGINIIQKFHQFETYEFPSLSLSGLKWIYKYDNGFIAWIRDQLIIISEQDGNQWQLTVAFDRIENILEIYEDSIVLLCGNDVFIYDFAHIWLADDPLISIPIAEEEYPISVSLDTATLHNLSCIFTEKLTRLSVTHGVYLDKIVDRSLALGLDVQKIDEKYHYLKHYKFSLEKILSNKILEHKGLDSILSLIDIYDTNSSDSLKNEVGKLEIIGNCLRKIETKHWDYLFESVKLTPRDLITRCIELSEAKVLGTLLMVFLNYDDGIITSLELTPKLPPTELKTVDDKTKGKNKKKGKKRGKNKAAGTLSPQPASAESGGSSVSTILKDETLIVQVLKIFVSTATLSTSKEQAQEYWDFALQLLRFLRALDSRGNTNLAQRCLDML